MEINVKAIHFDATVKLQQFINKKVEKLAKYSEDIASADVNLKVVKPETSLNKKRPSNSMCRSTTMCLHRKWPTPSKKPSTCAVRL